MTRETLLSKLSKIRALAERGGTEEEAATAAAMLGKFMAEHQVAEAELDVHEDQIPADEEVAGDCVLDPSFAGWRSALAMAVAASLGGRCYKTGKVCRVIGRKSEVQAASYVYAALVRQIEEIANKSWPEPDDWGRTPPIGQYRTAFRAGCTSRVAERLSESANVARRAAEAGASSQALIRIDRYKLAVQSTAAKLHLRAGRRTRYHSDGFKDGRAAGNSVHLGGGAAIGAGRRLLGSGQ